MRHLIFVLVLALIVSIGGSSAVAQNNNPVYQTSSVYYYQVQTADSPNTINSFMDDAFQWYQATVTAQYPNHLFATNGAYEIVVCALPC